MSKARSKVDRPRKTVKPAVLRDIISRVVSVAQPDKIILFGSAARGTMGPNSDVDLLVIKGGKFRRDRLVEKIYHNLYGCGEPVDVIVVTPDEVEQYRDAFCLVIHPALKEGRIVYAAKATPRKRSARVAQSGA